MRNPTHVVIGMCGALALGAVAHVPVGFPEALAGGVAGLLPNVDYALPALERSHSQILRRLATKTPAGGLTHSAIVMLPLATLLGGSLALITGRPGLLVAVVAGVLAHLLLDLFGEIGIQLWAPLSRQWIAFPPWERTRPKRGGAVELLLFCGGFGGLLFLAVRRLLPYAIQLVQRFLGGGQ